MTLPAKPTDSFHFIGSKGNAFMDYMTKLDPQDRKPYFDMLSKLRLGDNSMVKPLGAGGKPGKGLLELRDMQPGGPRVYGFLDGGNYIVLGASKKNDQDEIIAKAVEAKKEYDELKVQGKIDPKRHTKMHFHTGLPGGHLSVAGKPSSEFADRHGKPIPPAPPERPHVKFNKGSTLRSLGVALSVLGAAASSLLLPHEEATAAEVKNSSPSMGQKPTKGTEVTRPSTPAKP